MRTTFIIILEAPSSSDGIRGLRALLKHALRRYQLRAIDAREVHEIDQAEASREARPNASYRKEFAELRQKYQERRRA